MCKIVTKKNKKNKNEANTTTSSNNWSDSQPIYSVTKSTTLTNFLSIFALMSLARVKKASSTLMLALALVSKNFTLYSMASCPANITLVSTIKI